MLFILSFSAHFFQIYIPLCSKDEIYAKKGLKFMCYPYLIDKIYENSDFQVEVKDFSSLEVKNNEENIMNFINKGKITRFKFNNLTDEEKEYFKNDENIDYLIDNLLKFEKKSFILYFSLENISYFNEINYIFLNNIIIGIIKIEEFKKFSFSNFLKDRNIDYIFNY